MYDNSLAVRGTGVAAAAAGGAVVTNGLWGVSYFEIAFWLFITLVVWGLGYLSYRKFRKMQIAKK